MFNAKRGRLNQTFKSMAQQVRCPTCNRRFFDGFFVGVLEIICPRCGDPIIVTCEVPVSAAAGNGVTEGEKLIDQVDTVKKEDVVDAAPLTAVLV